MVESGYREFEFIGDLEMGFEGVCKQGGVIPHSLGPCRPDLRFRSNDCAPTPIAA